MGQPPLQRLHVTSRDHPVRALVPSACACSRAATTVEPHPRPPAGLPFAPLRSPPLPSERQHGKRGVHLPDLLCGAQGVNHTLDHALHRRQAPADGK